MSKGRKEGGDSESVGWVGKKRVVVNVGSVLLSATLEQTIIASSRGEGHLLHLPSREGTKQSFLLHFPSGPYTDTFLTSHFAVL